MTKTCDDFCKKFDALSAFDPNTQFISKNFEVVSWLGRLVERFCSLFSSDERYSSQKYNHQEVAKNINEFIKTYITKNTQHYFQKEAGTPEGLRKIEKIIGNLLILQERFAHGKNERLANNVKKVFDPSIRKLIRILPKDDILNILFIQNSNPFSFHREKNLSILNKESFSLHRDKDLLKFLLDSKAKLYDVPRKPLPVPAPISKAESIRIPLPRPTSMTFAPVTDGTISFKQRQVVGWEKVAEPPSSV